MTYISAHCVGVLSGHLVNVLSIYVLKIADMSERSGNDSISAYKRAKERLWPFKHTLLKTLIYQWTCAWDGQRFCALSADEYKLQIKTIPDVVARRNTSGGGISLIWRRKHKALRRFVRFRRGMPQSVRERQESIKAFSLIGHRSSCAAHPSGLRMTVRSGISERLT